MFEEVLENRNDERSHLDIFQNISDLIDSGNSLEEIKKISRKDYSQINKMLSLNENLTLKDISAMAKEKILATAIYDYIKSGQKLNEEMIRSIGFRLVEEKSYIIEADKKEIIRLDCSGLISNSKFNLSKEYNTAINIFDLNQSKTKDKDTARKILQNAFNYYSQTESKNKSTKQFNFGQDNSLKPSKNSRSKFRPSRYNLNEAPIWMSCYSQFNNFKSIEKTLCRSLAERNISPEIVKHMNAHDFQDLMFRTYRIPNEDLAKIFPGVARERVKQIANNPKNEEMLRLYMQFKGLPKDYIDERIKFMKEYGTVCKLFSLHHIDHVKNAGKFTNYSEVNNPDNLILMSSEIHLLQHHRDGMTDQGNYVKISTEKGKYDMILGVTDYFRAPFTGIKKSKNLQMYNQELPFSKYRKGGR